MGHTPISYARHVLTCGSGCGEIYWGEWTDDPPADCDPCDNHGNWIGHRACEPRIHEKILAGLNGGYAGGGCDCDTCGKSAVIQAGGVLQKTSGPTPAASPDAPLELQAPPMEPLSDDPVAPAGVSNDTRPPRLFHSARFTR